MGKKPRSKGVDVTKSLLQSASVSDYIAVQVSPNNVVTVSEDELSPTQGSEAAFALRRDGKLDSTMKLCLNWRAGACHNFASCTFAHVTQYYGVDNPGGAGSHPHMSGGAADGNSGATGRAGPGTPMSGSGDGRSPWLAKVAPSGSSGSAPGVSGSLPSSSNWASKGTSTATTGHGYVDLAEAMAAKASQQQNRAGRPAAATAASAATATSATEAHHGAESPEVNAPDAVTETASPPHTFLSLKTASAETAASNPTMAPATTSAAVAPAVKELLLRQLTGATAETGPTGALPPATSVPSLAATPRHQGIPAPRSGVLAASPFSTSPYAATTTTTQPAMTPQWGSPYAAVAETRPSQPMPHISPSMGDPSPLIRHLMTLLIADQ